MYWEGGGLTIGESHSEIGLVVFGYCIMGYQSRVVRWRDSRSVDERVRK